MPPLLGVLFSFHGLHLVPTCSGAFWLHLEAVAPRGPVFMIGTTGMGNCYFPSEQPGKYRGEP